MEFLIVCVLRHFFLGTKESFVYNYAWFKMFLSQFINCLCAVFKRTLNRLWDWKI